jgi:hypothetical protein
VETLRGAGREHHPNAKKITGFILQVYKTATIRSCYIDSVAFLKTAESTTLQAAPKPPAAETEAYRARWTQAAAKAACATTRARSASSRRPPRDEG